MPWTPRSSSSRARCGHLLGVVAAGAGQDGHASAGLVEHQFHDAQVLLARERRALARRAARHQEVHALVDLPPREPAHGSLVHRAGGA